MKLWMYLSETTAVAGLPNCAMHSILPPYTSFLGSVWHHLLFSIYQVAIVAKCSCYKARPLQLFPLHLIKRCLPAAIRHVGTLAAPPPHQPFWELLLQFAKHVVSSSSSSSSVRHIETLPIHRSTPPVVEYSCSDSDVTIPKISAREQNSKDHCCIFLTKLA